MEFYDNGEVFRPEGSNVSLARGFIPKDEWEATDPEVKLALLRAGIYLIDQHFALHHNLCDHCGEPILPDEPLFPIANARMHYECGFRGIAGSVGHQRGECLCHGKEDISEEGMTPREAAKAATDYWHRMNR